MTESIVLQQPQAAAEQLLLLFHGFGATPKDMVALGNRLALAGSTAIRTGLPRRPTRRLLSATSAAALWAWMQGGQPDGRP